MATNEVVERDDICLMDGDELNERLIEAGFSEETSSVIRGIIRHNVAIIRGTASTIVLLKVQHLQLFNTLYRMMENSL